MIDSWLIDFTTTRKYAVSTRSITGAKARLNDWISSAIDWTYTLLESLFVSDSDRPLGVAQIGWAGVVALAVWLAYAISGLRIAFLSLAVVLSFGWLGYWEESIETLIITGISVVLCVVIGLPAGIWMARSKRASAAITPVLDTMQTMPSFAYLTPLVLIFGIGPPGAVISTLIYALPPLTRISAYGLRTVSPTTVEATTALGSTSRQLLTKVQLPMARRTIIVGLNQTIMAALSMAIIAAFIGGPGLGVDIIRALAVLNVGVAFVAGMCIVLMAIMLDRATAAAGERSESTARSNVDPKRRRLILGVTGRGHGSHRLPLEHRAELERVPRVGLGNQDRRMGQRPDRHDHRRHRRLHPMAQ